MVPDSLWVRDSLWCVIVYGCVIVYASLVSQNFAEAGQQHAFVIESFRRGVSKILVLLGCYAALTGS
jgi:hypothetical protein